METYPDIQYYTGKWIRRGFVTDAEILSLGNQHGTQRIDLIADELSAAEVQIVNEDDLAITNQTNVLMNGLELVELISLALKIPLAPKIKRSLYQEIIQQGSYELDLMRLDYLDRDDNWYYLSPDFNRLQQSIRHLFNSGQIPFSKDWKSGRRTENLVYLNSLIKHSLFQEEILPLIRNHYLQLRSAKLFVKWIMATGNRNATMMDIILAGLRISDQDLVRSILFSNQPSTAEAALKNRHDVCYSCTPEERCFPIREISDPYNVLLEYRYSCLDNLKSTRYPGLSWSRSITTDWMIAKFFIPYSIVVSAKRWMFNLCILKKTAIILDKGHGQYCPKLDAWPIILD